MTEAYSERFPGAERYDRDGLSVGVVLHRSNLLWC
jgi:hypothetical protein